MSQRKNKYCISTYKESSTFEERQAQCKNILAKHRDKIPIIIEKLKNITTPLPDLDKHKYLVQDDLYMNQILYILYKKLDISKSESIYLFANDTLLNNSESIMTVYHKYKDPDGFLYLFYTAENVFG